MCLIVSKPNKNASLSIQDFKSSHSRNADGTGIMFLEDGRVRVEKTMGPLKDHLELYAKHMHREQFILHHRLGTHGTKDMTNVHPFEVLSIDKGDPYDLYMVHNGVIPTSKFSSYDNTLSDTNLFVKEYMTPLLRQFPMLIDSETFQVMLHDFVGSNKLAFMSSLTDEHGKARIWIFNKTQGIERNGCWLSNSYSVTTYDDKQRYNYGRNHGVRSNGYGAYGNYEDENYEYANGGWYRKDWTNANKTKEKLDELLSGTDIDSLMDRINLYSGMAEKSLETLFIDEPHLVYDMIYLLDTNQVDESLLKEAADKVAARLYTLLQGYSKKKAA